MKPSVEASVSKRWLLHNKGGDFPINDFLDVHYAILRLLAGCGWVSHTMLELTGYSYSYRTRSLKLLLDQQFIRKQGQGKNKAYTLTAKGRNHLAGFNARRFREEVIAETKQLSRHPERAVLRGDTAAMLSFAGFAVHMDDKPDLPVTTPPLPESPSPEDWKRLFQNGGFFSYAGEIDRKVYTRHTSAVGCYYDATAIKELAGPLRMGYCGNWLFPRLRGADDALLSAAGLPQPGCGDEISGDRREKPAKSAAVQPDFDWVPAAGNRRRPDSGGPAQQPVYAKRKGRKGYAAISGSTGELLQPTNLGNPAYYLPLCRDSLTLLELMRYPMWKETLIREISRELFQLENNTRWTYEPDGCTVYLLVCLNLPQIDLTLRKIRAAPHQRARIICLDWQEPLFCRLLEPYAKDRDIQLTRLPAAYMEDLSERIKRCWEECYGEDK